jgi:hypothetical protein
MAEMASRSSWAGVWTRAVIGPAWRRVQPVWLGTGIVGALILGPEGMPPRDLTSLALRSPGFGALLVVTWILLFLPTARVIVRADGARYLRSLPAPRWSATAIAASSLVVLQLPWLAMWLVGARAIGALVVAAVTGVIVALAWWRPRPPHVGALHWRGPRAAFFGVYMRALRRRADDALLRATGFALLAGGAGGLFARNNELAPREASVLAIEVIAVVLVPGWAGVMLPLVETHRESAWLAQSSGVSERTRIGVLAAAVVAVYVVTAAIAAAAATALVPAAAAWIAPIALATAAGIGLGVTRSLVRAERSQATTSRAVVGAIAASAIAFAALSTLGVPGVAAVVAIGVLAVGTA